MLDISTADFPGIIPVGCGYSGPRPTPQLHPHLRLEETMTSIPKVFPGDMVFWHCVSAATSKFSRLLFLVTYSSCFSFFCRTWFIPSRRNTLELQIPQVRLHIHVRKTRCSLNGGCQPVVMYIGAVPKTPQNSAYVVKQVETFLAGQNPPDFIKLKEGTTFVGLGGEVDVKESISRVAMGLPIEVA